VEKYAQEMLGSVLVTNQTGPEGLPVNMVYIEPGSEIDREIYLSILLDREKEMVSFVVSPSGGMNIEEVAENEPEKIFKISINPATGLMLYQIRQLCSGIDLNKEQCKQFSHILKRMYALFLEKDASLIEVNPLIVKKDGDLMALDAKINIESNALFRQKDLVNLRDPSQEDKTEHEAAQNDLNYVSLDGDIACMVNGAGLAMATMDLIKLHGGKPANFLDVGGGATSERVAFAFKLILSNKNVQAILVNIFGGIVRCDLIAQGIIDAVKETGVSTPVVVRLEGTNVEKGRSLLKESGLKIISASSLTDAAKKAVTVVNQ
ncbi:MAG TPA: ADP-forming succinate--CoA ligase subunit beta, partial [Woeseiaceae bacterium]|nr:ADP-forming succinate--CoA ligase subunit beta [Woeseiaceae bacterium]